MSSFIVKGTKGGKKYSKVNDRLSEIADNVVTTTNNDWKKRRIGRSKETNTNITDVEKRVTIDPKVLSRKPLYLVTQWGESDDIEIPNGGTKLSIDGEDYTRYDSNDALYLTNKSGVLIAVKPSLRQSKEIAKRNEWNDTRQVFNMASKHKPNVNRGKKTKGANTVYNCHGYRKEPLDTINGKYKYKSNTPDSVIKTIDESVGNLVEKMEKVAAKMTSKMKNVKVIKKVKRELKLPAVSEKPEGIATQASLGQNYHSQVHVDRDMYYSLLTCLSGEDADHDEIMYYFCFPEYKYAIGMRSGELLLFNPLVYHSCSNCKFVDSFIFSAYVSEKTVMTAGIEMGLHN